MIDWKRVAESEAVPEEAPPAMPRWDGEVPCCSYDGCVHYDGKRCVMLGERPSSLCVPVVGAMAEQLDKLTELYDVTQSRLEAFEGLESDARTCAEWVVTVALKSSDVYSAARRYLCGETALAAKAETGEV